MDSNESSRSKVITDCYDVIRHISFNKKIFSDDTTMKEITKTDIQNQFIKFQGFLKNDSALRIEDIFQEAIIILFNLKIKERENGVKTLKNDKYYFFTIFKNLLIKNNKKKSQYDNIDLEKLSIETEPEVLTKEIPIKEILFTEPALKQGGEFQLNIKEISAYFSHEIYNWEIQDVSGELGIKEGTIKSHNYRAKQTLRKYLEKYYSDYA